MSSLSDKQRLWSAWALVLVLTLLVAVADRYQWLANVRLALHDSLSPGRLLVAAVSAPESGPEPSADVSSEVGRLQQQLQLLDQQRRQLLIENARLNQRLQHQQQSDGYVQQTIRLAGHRLVSARVLSQDGIPSLLRQPLIDAGRAQGLLRSQLVLDASGPVLDQGTQQGIQDGSVVLSGAVVLGRVDTAGRWVSRLMPVTDSGFSAGVRLIRRTERGTFAGPSGLLEGTGGGCRVTGIPETESVSVGDGVFSTSVAGIQGPQLYLGQVVRAEFEAGGNWVVDVEPAVPVSEIDEVAVAIPRLQETRVSQEPHHPEPQS